MYNSQEFLIQSLPAVPLEVQQVHRSSLSMQRPFVEANTQAVDLQHLQSDCTVPVFAKDNERTIAHQEFIDVALQAINQVYGNGQLVPEIRVSHPIKGRTPDAIHKAANQLQEHEKTIYYERMAFAVEIPSITQEINGNLLTLTAGGVRAYNAQNLYNKKALEYFKFFIGFKNMVCCNMCISTDGAKEDLRVGSTEELFIRLIRLMGNYSVSRHLERMQQLNEQYITEKQFAQILGKCRLYHHLPKGDKLHVPPLQFNDTQVNEVARAYFHDESFSRQSDGKINLWKMYNLFTGANKSSYIDMFLHRGVNASELVEGISDALIFNDSPHRWYLE